jgi:hypothetical protein
MPVNRINNLTIHEILTRASQGKTKEEKIKILRHYNAMALRDILKIGYDDTISFVFPEGAPPYTPSSEESPPSSLRRQNKRFKYFLTNVKTNLPMVRREKMFINMLESIDPNDAKLMIAAKDKKLNGMYKGITKKLVMEAFPGLIRV